MDFICERQRCTGCSACANICKAFAIVMTPDERGFLHPAVDKSKCVDCGMCKRVCPISNGASGEPSKAVYAALAVDDKLRSSSSSGGIFSLLAESTLDRNGVVFGAAFDEDMHVRHIAVDSAIGLGSLRGSKYVQSEIGQAYTGVKKLLDAEKDVLFSGTPCQIAGLRSFLGRDYDNLLCLDILCHGVPSPAVFKAFVDNKELVTGKRITGVNFREKDPGWKSFSELITFEDDSSEIDNSYFFFFVRNYCLRSSCLNCSFSSPLRTGDITLGDYWGYKEKATGYLEDDDLGISLVLLNTNKGIRAFNSIKKRIAFEQRTMDDAVRGNPVLKHPCSANENSESFWLDFQNADWDALVNKYSIPKEKLPDNMAPDKRRYYSLPFKKRHRRHKLVKTIKLPFRILKKLLRK